VAILDTVLAFLFLLFLGLVKAAYLLGGLALIGHGHHDGCPLVLGACALIRCETVPNVLARIAKFHFSLSSIPHLKVTNFFL
jgi:hypothetical protein